MNISTLRMFVRVARRGSFSAAGRDMKLPQSTVSRQIAELEQVLGVTLFLRSTRAVTLTEAGRKYLDRLEPILSALDEAEYEIRGVGHLRGTLRVGLSSSMAIREIAPRLPGFLARHSDLKVELLCSDDHQDLVVEAVDIALRFGALADSTMVARKLASWPIVLVASPAYLATMTRLCDPLDLVSIRLIAGPHNRQCNFTFRKAMRTVTVKLDPAIATTQNEVATALALSGVGAVSMSVGGCRRELESGALVQVLPDWDLGAIDLHAVFASGRGTKPAARAFAAFLYETFKQEVNRP